MKRSAVLRRAVELGVDFIDTADSYGPYVSEELIHEALHPYPAGLVIATKAGLTRTGPGQWHAGRAPRVPAPGVRDEPAPARAGAHRPLPAASHRSRRCRPRSSSACSRELRDEGKVRHVGLSEVSGRRHRGGAARSFRSRRFRTATTSSIAAPRTCSSYCEREGIGFIPWFPIAERAPRPARRAAARRGGRDRARRRRRSRSPGCSPARRSCCPSRARRPSRTSRRTAPRRRWRFPTRRCRP